MDSRNGPGPGGGYRRVPGQDTGRSSRDSGREPERAREEASRLRGLRAPLRLPLFYKILLANTLVIVLGAVVGTYGTVALVRAGSEVPLWLLAGGFALLGLALSVTGNAVLLRLALSPLSGLERIASRLETLGESVEERAPVPPWSDPELARLIRVFNRMLDAIARYRTKLRELAVRALETAEVERRWLARELQEDTAQRLASILVKLRLVDRSEIPEERQLHLEEARAETVETLEWIRRTARSLHPPELEEIGVDRALRAMVRQETEGNGPAFEMELAPVDPWLRPEDRLALFRIVQEAVRNVVRHAGASRGGVRLRREGDWIRAEVMDDGRGFDAPDALEVDGGSCLGLFTMQERARYVGGRVRVLSRPGAGTRLRVEIPARTGSP